MGRGGFRNGAGRPGWRPKAESLLRLDVRALARHGIVGRPSSVRWRWTNDYSGEEVGSIGINGGDSHIQLAYTINGSPREERVELVRTGCTFGGSRPWFRCPACERRSGVLFLRGCRFTCRICSAVAYTSQSEDAIARIWRAQSKLERLLDDHWAKPKGMHRRTKQRITDRIIDLEIARDTAIAQALTRLFGHPW